MENVKNTVKKRISELTGTRTGQIRLAVFLLVFVLNCLTVPTLDDLGYKINSGILDILHREYLQYMTWTGRTVAHLIARSFLALPKIIFNLCNSWCFVHLCTLICAHVSGKTEQDNPVLFLMSVLLVFLTVPLFGQTCLWETGSCNYLWTTMIVLQFLQYYRFAVNNNEEKHSALLMLGAGIAAGWTNENTGGALILMVMYFVFLAYRKNQLENWMFAGLLGSLIGFVLMVKAPGNSIRALDFVSTGGKAYEIIHDIYGALEVMQDGQKWLWIMLGACLAVCILLKAKGETLLNSLAYALAGAAAVCAIILSPVPVLFDRSMFGATVLLIIGVMICIYELLSDTVCRKAAAGLIGAMIIMSGFHYIRALADLAYVRYQHMGREAYVTAQKEMGNLNPTIPMIYNEFMTPYNAMFGLGDVSEYRVLWPNQYYAEAHGLESVQSTSLDRWNRIYRNGDPELMNITDFAEYLETAVKGNRVLLVNSSCIDSVSYSEYLAVLEKYGIKSSAKEDSLYLMAVIENGMAAKQTVSGDPAYIDGNIGEAYYYVSAQTVPEYSDILVDGLEYTNDNPGITIVAYDKDLGRVTDSVTFNSSSEQGGDRYYIER